MLHKGTRRLRSTHSILVPAPGKGTNLVISIQGSPPLVSRKHSLSPTLVNAHRFPHSTASGFLDIPNKAPRNSGLISLI